MTDFPTPMTVKSFIPAFEMVSHDSVYVHERLFSITPRVSVTILKPSLDVRTFGQTRKRRNYKITTNMTTLKATINPFESFFHITYRLLNTIRDTTPSRQNKNIF